MLGLNSCMEIKLYGSEAGWEESKGHTTQRPCSPKNEREMHMVATRGGKQET